jgi:uncharacterized membrane protein YkvI
LLVPGLVFQAIVIGGGYATGRELVEFFMTGSLVSGLLGMLVAGLVWSAVLAVTFENARRIGASDYRTFLRALIGRLWIAYELCFAALLLIVLSVLGAAAGEIVKSRLGLASVVGTGAMMLAVCALVIFGTKVIERFLAGWSLLLYALFILILILSVAQFGDQVATTIAASTVDGSFVWQGISYAGYNLAIVPGMLYVVARLHSQRDAMVAGMLGGFIAILPAMLFFVALVPLYPRIVASPVPIDDLLLALDQPWLSVLFYIALFGIFIKTGAALLHALNERFAGLAAEGGRVLSGRVRALIAGGAMIVAIGLAQGVGIVRLISDGYPALTVAFLLVFVLPVLTIGTARIVRENRSAREAGTVQT